jgi:hypothetical protein
LTPRSRWPQRGSHLDAIAIGYESMSAVGMMVEGGGAAVAAVTGVEHDRAMERADAAISVFEIEAKLAKIAYGIRTLAAIPGAAEETVGEHARLYDLTVVLQPETTQSSYDNIIPQGVLFNSGGPMLMVPYIHKGPLDARHVGIAWDGSRLAARALRDALPFLTAAHLSDSNPARAVACNAGAYRTDRHFARRACCRTFPRHGPAARKASPCAASNRFGP